MLQRRVRNTSTIAAALVLVPALSGGAAQGEEVVELRPLGPDPHPYTTEQGRFVVEFTPLDYTHDRRNPERTNVRVDAFELPLTVKYGATDDLEVQVGADLFAWERERDADTSERSRSRGFGDTELRAKYNLWGNDEGETAIAVLPYLGLPTGSRDVRVGGLYGGSYVPFEWEFADGWAFEWNPGFHAARNAADDGVTFAFSSEWVLERELFDGVDAFVEFDYEIAAESGSRWVGAIGAGLTFELNENTVIEPEVSFGVTRSADTVTGAIHLIRRF